MHKVGGDGVCSSPLCCGLLSSCPSSQSYPMFLFKDEMSALSKPSTQPDELENELVCDLQLNAGFKLLNHHIKTFPRCVFAPGLFLAFFF